MRQKTVSCVSGSKNEGDEMPVHVEKQGKKWVTVDDKGKVHGHSSSKAKAQASANAINAAAHGWKPTGKKRRKTLLG